MRRLQLLAYAVPLLSALACNDVTSPSGPAGPGLQAPKATLVIPTTTAQVSVGAFHSCGLKMNGTVICWGSNSSGQITVPDGLASVVQIGAGGNHTCALRTDGTVVCWGLNGFGQTNVPAGLASVAQVSAGNRHTCALKTDGTIVCWGRNLEGQTIVPGGLASAVQVSAGGAHTCALGSDGVVVCWGRNDFGQATVPAGLASVAHSVSQVSAGSLHTCALKTNGTVVCWGYNVDGEATVPGGLASVRQVSAGNGHTCALKTDGTVVCWGYNADGETNVPAGIAPVAQLSAGNLHTCAVKTNGTVVCWGSNAAGQTTVPAGLDLSIHGPLVAYPGAPVAGHIVLCKDANSPAGTYGFSIISSGTIAGDVVQGGASLSPGQCRIVFSRTAFSNVTVTLTITESVAPGAAVHAITRTQFGTTTLFSGPSPTIAVQANSSSGGVVTYKNVAGNLAMTVGGTVTGLAGSGLALRLNGGAPIGIAAGATTFTFPSFVYAGDDYRVTLSGQPATPTQTCTLVRGQGRVDGLNVTNIAVQCIANATSPLSGTYTLTNAAGLRIYLTFWPDGTYVLALRSDDPSCGPSNGNGIEYGVYNWNALTGAFSIRTAAVDTNGPCGLSNPGPPPVGASGTLVKSGNTVTFSNPDGTFVLSAVASTPSTIVGSFGRDDGNDGGFVILQNDGTYLIVDAQFGTGNGVFAGYERGCYTVTGSAIAASLAASCLPDGRPALDLNGTGGFFTALGTPVGFVITAPNSFILGGSRTFIRILPN